MIREMKFFVFLMIIVVYGIANVALAENGRGLQFDAHDEKNAGYSFPAFRFSVMLPDGSLIGWDKNSGQWIGTVKLSQIEEGVFKYPTSSWECTSTEPHIGREINLPSSIIGEYSIRNALYCKQVFSGVNRFIGSGMAAILGGVPDGKVEVTFYPETNTVIFACFDFLVSDEEPLNGFCLNDKYNRRFVAAPGVEQKVELNYDFASITNTTAEKVVTAPTISGSWESCYKLGLIKNSGLYTSVQKKLENAKRKCDAGDLNAAEGIYRALANELQAQYGKGIDAQCADILIEDLQADIR